RAVRHRPDARVAGPVGGGSTRPGAEDRPPPADLHRPGRATLRGHQRPQAPRARPDGAPTQTNRRRLTPTAAVPALEPPRPIQLDPAGAAARRLEGGLK